MHSGAAPGAECRWRDGPGARRQVAPLAHLETLGRAGNGVKRSEWRRVCMEVARAMRSAALLLLLQPIGVCGWRLMQSLRLIVQTRAFMPLLQ